MAVVNEARAVLTAEDRASAVLAMVSRNFDRLNRAADRLDRTANNPRAQQQMQQSLSRTTALTSRLGAAAMRAAGPIAGMFTLYGAGTGLAAANRAFAQNERAMTRIAVTADASRAAQQAGWQELQKLADETAQPVGKVRDGLDALVASGRSLPEAMAFLPAVARTAQASGAEVADIAKTADSVGESFKLAGGDMQAAFDIMAAGGKAGKFELKDMARYLPSLGPAASAIGFHGKQGLSDLVAMLQVMRKGSGTAEEAVASMNNILNKMESDKTTKALKALGVDAEGAFKKARAEGKNLIGVFEELVDKALKGDRSRLGEIIDDAEFKRGVQALMMFKGEWQDLSRTMQASSAGTVANDLARVLGDKQATVDRFQNSASRLADTLGKRLAPAFKSVTEGATAAMDAVNEALQPGEADEDRRKRLNLPQTRQAQVIENAQRAQERQKKLDDPTSEYYSMRDGGFAGAGARAQSSREADLRAKKSRTPQEQSELDRIEHGGLREQSSQATPKRLDDRRASVETRVASHMQALDQHMAARRAYTEDQELKDYRERQAQRARHLASERAFAAEQERSGGRPGAADSDVAFSRSVRREEARQTEIETAGDVLAGRGQAGVDLQSAFMRLIQEKNREALAGRDGGSDVSRSAMSGQTHRLELQEALYSLLSQDGQKVDGAKYEAILQKLDAAATAMAGKNLDATNPDRNAITGLSEALRGILGGDGGRPVQAEVKPDQITAQANVDLTSKVEVEVKPSTDFWTTVKSFIRAETPKSMAGVSLPGKEGGAPSSAASRF